MQTLTSSKQKSHNRSAKLPHKITNSETKKKRVTTAAPEYLSDVPKQYKPNPL